MHVAQVGGRTPVRVRWGVQVGSKSAKTNGVGYGAVSRPPPSSPCPGRRGGGDSEGERARTGTGTGGQYGAQDSPGGQHHAGRVNKKMENRARDVTDSLSFCSPGRDPRPIPPTPTLSFPLSPFPFPLSSHGTSTCGPVQNSQGRDCGDLRCVLEEDGGGGGCETSVGDFQAVALIRRRAGRACASPTPGPAQGCKPVTWSVHRARWARVWRLQPVSIASDAQRSEARFFCSPSTSHPHLPFPILPLFLRRHRRHHGRPPL